MSLEISHEHECSLCGTEPKGDECYCASCRDEYALDAYEAGREAGSKEGYDAAREEFDKS